MAYGKIKADAIIYDNSGSDVEKTIAVLADPTPEGTAVKSTGEAVTTKFLRTDGDGSSSWQVVPVPSTITVADESSETTCFPLFATAATGDLPPKTGTNLTFNSSSGLLTATSFNGALTGNVTGNADTATVATAVTVVDESTDTTCYVLFADGATGNLSVKSGTNLAFNSSTGLLSPSAVTTTGNVTVGGDLVVSGSTTTVNTATLEVEDKNIELGKVSSPSDTTADGGGITLKGATDKTINWVNSTDNWTFNQDIEIASGSDSSLYITAGEGNNSSLYLIADEGDDNGDYWCIYSSAGDNDLYFKTKTSGSYVTAAKVTEEGEVHDALGDLRAIPPNATTSAYTLVASDRGKTVTNTTGGVTIPYNVFAAGDAVTIVNHSGSAITLTQGSNLTLYHSLNGATGNRTLKQRGMATVWYQAQNLAYIGGPGLS